jgi:hypothetical protein
MRRAAAVSFAATAQEHADDPGDDLPVRFTLALYQSMPFCPFPRSHQVPAPHTTATDPDPIIDREILTMRLP